MIVAQWAVFQRGCEGWGNLAILLGQVTPDAPRTHLPRPKARLSAEQITVVPPGQGVAALRMVSFDVRA